jgi:hypothetical protein
MRTVEADEGGQSAQSERLKLRAWIAFLGGPIIWILQLQTSYTLVPWTCLHGMHFLLHLTSAVFLAGAVALALSARMELKNHDDSAVLPAGLLPSARFMLLVGAWNSALFGLLIFAQGIPSFFISPCID